jgi:hypothetical protein
MRKPISRTIYFLFAIFIIASVSISSCKKDTTPSVVKTALADSLTAANALLTNAVEGVAAGQYQMGSKAALQTTVTAIQAIYDNPASTQIEINNAITNLASAVTLFKTKAIVPIAQESLIAQWTFSEGTGTTVTDASSSHLVGTFKPGYSTIVNADGTLPQWTTDRYGVANQALHFIKGGHIEVPYTSILVPAEITISLWVKLDTIFADNYMLSQDSWHCWKLQLQSVSKVFFTVATTTGIYDKDWVADGVPINEWHNIAVTYKDGEEDFYGDGKLIKSWVGAVTGTIKNADLVDFCIGQEIPNNISPAVSYSPPHFKGSLDDIRIYNKALTAAQVTSIYSIEKPPGK